MLHVTHLVDAMDSQRALWGKERVIESLMVAQRQSGAVTPRLVCFTPTYLSTLMSQERFDVASLGQMHERVPVRSLTSLRRLLASQPQTVLHTHGYKANVIGRLARLSGAQMRSLVSTCHGWVDETLPLQFYNRLDRSSVFVSDATTVPDAGMMARFPPRTRLFCVPNGIPDRPVATAEARSRARERFGFRPGELVVGVLARLTEKKGVLDVLRAARALEGTPYIWALAGSGELKDRIEAEAPPSVRAFGYIEDSAPYLDAVDVYLQPSHSEGLSLALLEAMRARLPIVATRVGATMHAVRDGREALLVAPRRDDEIVRALDRLAASPQLASRIADAARERFASTFVVERQHRAFLEVYRSRAEP